MAEAKQAVESLAQRHGLVSQRVECLGVTMSQPYPADEIGAALAACKLPISEALLSQSVVAGVGNIAKSEILFRTGLDPRGLVGQLQTLRGQVGPDRRVLPVGASLGSHNDGDLAGAVRRRRNVFPQFIQKRKSDRPSLAPSIISSWLPRIGTSWQRSTNEINWSITPRLSMPRST